LEVVRMNRLPTTPAERERIADLLRMGIAHKAIAQRMDVSEATVKRVAAEARRGDVSERL
jgi:DNA-binding NarL/FixJ family response regulator